MKARFISSLAAAGVLALVVSCSQDENRSISAPTEALRGKTPTPTCSFSTTNNDGKLYFVKQKDPVFALLDTMQTAVRTYGTSSAQTQLAGMKVLGRLGTAAQNGVNLVKGTAAQGNTFANDVLLCMGVASIDFTDALGPTGLFAVRDNSTSYAVVSHKFNTDGTPASGAPLYGAEPSSGNWPVAQKTLFYGHLVPDSVLAKEAASGVLFDLKTLPANLTFTPQIRAGVCDVRDETARILHLHGTDATILPPAGVPAFCTTQPPIDAYRSGFGSMMDLAASWFAPKSLFAAPAFGGGGGLVSGLSEIGPVTFTPVVTFSTPPKNSKLSSNPSFNPPVTVTVKSTNGNPLQGVLVTLKVVGNSGSFTNPPVGSAPDTTKADGSVSFPNLYIDKAGGYTITATSDVGGSASAFFNISGR